MNQKRIHSGSKRIKKKSRRLAEADEDNPGTNPPALVESSGDEGEHESYHARPKTDWENFASNGVMVLYQQEELFFIPKDNIGRGDCLLYALLDTNYFRSISNCSQFRQKLFVPELNRGCQCFT